MWECLCTVICLPLFSGGCCAEGTPRLAVNPKPQAFFLLASLRRDVAMFCADVYVCSITALRLIVLSFSLHTCASFYLLRSSIHVYRVSACVLVVRRTPCLGSFAFRVVSVVRSYFRVCHLCSSVSLAACPLMYLRSSRFAYPSRTNPLYEAPAIYGYRVCLSGGQRPRL